MPERRTMIVLGSLAGAMVIATCWLMLISPAGNQGGRQGGPFASFRDMSLSAIETAGDTSDALFKLNEQTQLDEWTAIVVRTSGGTHGSAATLNQLHQKAGLGTLAYHFTIGNGQGAGDGEMEIGPRWHKQQPGYTSMAFHQDPDARHVIDICLIGDWHSQAPTDKQKNDLIWLVQKLQKRMKIPADRILLGDGTTTKPGQFFPVAWFRQQLLTDTGT